MDGIAALDPSGFPLKAFPVELLNLITFRLDWGSIMDLWCSGDVTLHRLMKNRGVTRFKLTIKEKTPDYIFPFGWRFFANLSDLSLHLDDLNPVYMDSIRAGLQSASSMLRKLSLCFPDAELALFPPTAPPRSSSGHNQIENRHVSSESPDRLWFVSSKLPNLEFLELDSLSARGRLCNADIWLLPHSLTELRIRTRFSLLTSDAMAYLGPQIEILWISFKSCVNPVLSLPPQLHSLKILNKIEGLVMGLVPSNLTYFRAPKWRMNVENLACLPACTQKIKLDLYSGEESHVKLSMGIKDLILSSNDHSLDKQNFLPSGLLTLVCPSVLDITQTYWPNHLTSLEVLDVHYTGEMEAFPATLTYLCVHFSSGGPLTQRTYDTLIGSLPSTLMELYLNVDEISDYFIFPIEKFPSLRKLALLGPFECSKDLLQGLPRNIEMFYNRNEGTWDDEKCLELLPSSLRDLQLSMPSSCQLTCLKYLPTELTGLTIHIEGTATANDFRQLPRSLTRLYLRSLDNIEANAWSELPCSLKTLDLGTTILTEIDFSQLPSKLQWFSAPYSTIILSFAEIAAIPLKIKHLRLGANWIRDDQ